MSAYSYTDQVLQQLRAVWEYSRVSNYALYERYYGGDHPWEGVVSKAMRQQKDADGDSEFERFWKPANMAYVLVEEAVGYWAGAEIFASISKGGQRDTAKSELVTSQLRSVFYNEREEVARAQSLYGGGILRVRTPDTGVLKGYGVAPYQAGPWCMTFCEDPDDPYRVTQCVYQFVRGDYLWAQHITAYEIRLLKVAHVGHLGYAGVTAAAVTVAGLGTMGTVESTTENPWGVVPVYSFSNGNGASDLFPMLNAQDSLNKAIYNLESSAEYHGFPLLEIRGYAGRNDANGVPLDIDVSPGSYIKVDEKGGVKRLEAADLKQLLDAESWGYMRVAQQGRSPAVLAEYSGLGDSGRVPAFLLEPLKMRLNSKLSGAKHALEQALAQIEAEKGKTARAVANEQTARQRRAELETQVTTLTAAETARESERVANLSLSDKLAEESAKRAAAEARELKLQGEWSDYRVETELTGAGFLTGLEGDAKTAQLGTLKALTGLDMVQENGTFSVTKFSEKFGRLKPQTAVAVPTPGGRDDIVIDPTPEVQATTVVDLGGRTLPTQQPSHASPKPRTATSSRARWPTCQPLIP